MRKYIILIMLCLSAAASFGKDWAKIFNQDGFEQETLFDTSIYSIGGYFAMSTHATLLNDKVYPVVGCDFGMIINHSFILGFGGMGLPLTQTYRYDSRKTNDMAGAGWGGLLVGYVFMPESVVHPFVKVLTGSGSVGYRSDKDDFGGWAFFAAEATAGVDINFTKWFRLSPYIGYRYVYGNIDILDLTDAKLSGFNAGLSLSFGWF